MIFKWYADFFNGSLDGVKVETVCALIVAGLDHMSSFEEIHTELMIMILCDIIFIISHNVYNVLWGQGIFLQVHT